MPIVVHAMAEDEYECLVHRAARGRGASPKEALSKTFTPGRADGRGRAGLCHLLRLLPHGQRQGVPPVFPGLDGSAIATGPLEDHLDIIVNGKAGTAMQAFGRQLDAAQIAAVTHYERHAWSNNVGDVTQPRDVVEFMSSQE